MKVCESMLKSPCAFWMDRWQDGGGDREKKKKRGEANVRL